MATQNSVFDGIIESRFHPPGDRSSSAFSAISAQGTTTVAAGTTGVRHVVTGFSFCIASGNALSSGTVGVSVIDGSTGGTTYLWQGVMQVGTFGATMPITRAGLSIPGTAATALTAEFDRSITGAYQVVSIEYHDIGT